MVLALARDDFARLLGQLADIRTMWRFEALRKASSFHDLEIISTPTSILAGLNLSRVSICGAGATAGVAAAGAAVAAGCKDELRAP
jgi:hypothetical protein